MNQVLRREGASGTYDAAVLDFDLYLISVVRNDIQPSVFLDYYRVAQFNMMGQFPGEHAAEVDGELSPA